GRGARAGAPEGGGDRAGAGGHPGPARRLHQAPRCRGGVRRRGGAGGGPAVTTLTGRPYRVVGQSPAHHDFVDKVKGALHYAADWRLPGMLHGRIVRSQLPSARITGIDVSAARALPGVVAVLTAADVPSNRIVEMASGGLAELEVGMPGLATDRVRYLGEPVALVAAATQQIAAEAAELVSVDYEELPGVFDVESARADGAPLVHEVGNT